MSLIVCPDCGRKLTGYYCPWCKKELPRDVKDAAERAVLKAAREIVYWQHRYGDDFNTCSHDYTDWPARECAQCIADFIRTEMAEALEDVERLDWLERDGDVKCAMPVRDPETLRWWIYFDEAEGDVEDAPTLRAAIDAARAAGEEKDA